MAVFFSRQPQEWKWLLSVYRVRVQLHVPTQTYQFLEIQMKIKLSKINANHYWCIWTTFKQNVPVLWWTDNLILVNFVVQWQSKDFKFDLSRIIWNNAASTGMLQIIQTASCAAIKANYRSATHCSPASSYVRLWCCIELNANHLSLACHHANICCLAVNTSWGWSESNYSFAGVINQSIGQNTLFTWW